MSTFAAHVIASRSRMTPVALSSAGEQTGAMIALIPTDVDAQRLAIVGGEPASELHITLRYLGKAADLAPEARTRIVRRVAALFARTPPIAVDLFGPALFNPGGEEACVVGIVTGPDLDLAHDQAATAVRGIELPEPHAPWIPHITLAYTHMASRLLAVRTGPLVCDRVRIAVAGEHTDIPLTGATEYSDETP